MARTTTCQVEPYTDLDLAAVRASDLLRIGPDPRLHVERRVAGPDGMIFVGEGGAEERHDAIAHDLVDDALVLMNRLDHALEDRIDEISRFLGIAVREHLHRSFQVGEEDRDLLALSFKRGPRAEDSLGEVRGCVDIWRAEPHRRTGGLADWLSAFGAELRGSGQLVVASHAVAAQPRGALRTTPRAGGIFVLTMRTPHARISQTGRSLIKAR
jgi:hypothetical protein